MVERLHMHKIMRKVNCYPVSTPYVIGSYIGSIYYTSRFLICADEDFTSVNPLFSLTHKTVC